MLSRFKPSRRVIAHIGFHKTATIAIQEFCTENREALAAQGIHYPAATGELPGHQELAWVLMSAPPSWADRHYDAEAVMRHYAAALDASRDATLLVSSEDFCCESERVAPRLRALFAGAEMHIVAYVRDPFDFLLSRYLHEVLHDERRPFAAFVRDELATADFANRLGAWTRAFGVEHVTVRPYSVAMAGPGICADFLSLLGLQGMSTTPAERVVNAGAPPAFGQLFAYLNASPLEGEVRQRLKDAMVGAVASVNAPALPRMRAFFLADLAQAELDFLERCRTTLSSHFGIRFAPVAAQ